MAAGLHDLLTVQGVVPVLKVVTGGVRDVLALQGVIPVTAPPAGTPGFISFNQAMGVWITGMVEVDTDTTGGGAGTHAHRLIPGMETNYTRALLEDEEVITMVAELFRAKKKPH